MPPGSKVTGRDVGPTNDTKRVAAGNFRATAHNGRVALGLEFPGLATLEEFWEPFSLSAEAVGISRADIVATLRFEKGPEL